MHGGLGSKLPGLPGGTGPVLREFHAYLQFSRQACGRRDVWRLLGKHRGGQAVCVAGAVEPESGGGGAVAVRGNHDVFADAALGSRQGEEGWGGGAWRIGSYGSEVCARAGSARGGVHDVTRQEG